MVLNADGMDGSAGAIKRKFFHIQGGLNRWTSKLISIIDIIPGGTSSYVTTFSRNFSSTAEAVIETCPYEILGLPKNSSYALVKKTFLKLAMETHPDVVSEVTKENKEQMMKNFIKIRGAFEMIKPLDNGNTTIAKNLTTSQSSSAVDFNEWFYAETGKNAPKANNYLDHKQIHELKQFLRKNPGPSGLDRGGMWQLARMVSEYSSDKDERSDPRQIESREIRIKRRPKRR